MTDLEPLKAALAAGTELPWVNGSRNEHGVIRSPEHGLIAQCGPYGKQDADARLIVAAVNALPALIAEVETLRKVREAARAIIASDLDVAGRRYVVASDDPDMDALRAALGSKCGCGWNDLGDTGWTDHCFDALRVSDD